MSRPTRVTVFEVGPRDGLQNISARVDLEAKIRFVDLLSRTGLRLIEAGAFVHSKAVPQMADSGELFQRIERREGVRYPALVPNERGLDAAIAAGVTEVCVFTAASETFNQKNTNASIAESIQRFAPVLSRAHESQLTVRGYVSCAFGCPYEGAIAKQAVASVTADLFDLGVTEVSIGDTIGVATPRQVDEVMTPLGERFAKETLALHFHDTRGTALANVLAALDLGFSIFDSSAGGLGGCPFAPGATGNLATEDLIYLLDGLGIETGVDLTKLVEASRFMEETLGTPLPSRVLRAELSKGA